MATTTNYGWTTPDDTALVKDGASAIRTLGSSVDTTTKALNPSTTLGDVEYRSSTANTNTRLGIGTTGQVLTVAGGVPSWATPATTAFAGVALTGTGAQSVSNATNTLITFDTEDFDTDAFHSTSTDTSRITIPAGKGGKYQFTSHILFDSTSGAGRRISFFAKNGNILNKTHCEVGPVSGSSIGIVNSALLDLVATDYIECLIYQTTGGSINVDRPSSSFSTVYLGA